MKNFFNFLFLLSLLGNCVVPKKQFNELLGEKVKMEANLLDIRTKFQNLSNLKDSLQATLDSSLIKSEITKKKLDETNIKLADIKKEYDKLQTYYNNSLSNSTKINHDMKEQHKRLLAMQKTLNESTYNNQQLADSLKLREEKVAELKKMVAKSQKAINELKKGISAALLDFGESDLSIEQRNGKIYVSLSEQLLFKSSSIQIDPKGIKALNQLAAVLNTTPNINILIEGHTDNVPISRRLKYLRDNWDLSVLRATSIVRILIKGGVNPNVLTPAGRGQYLPVSANDTPSHKAENRRIDITITPDLNNIFTILEQD